MEKSQRDSTYSHILKYTGLLGGIQAVVIAVSVVRNKLVALILGPEGMGLSSLFTSTTQLIVSAAGMGIGTSAVQNLSEQYQSGDAERMQRRVEVIRSWTAIAALAGMLLCILFGRVLSNFTFSWGDHTLHYVFLAPAVGLMILTGSEIAVLKAVRRLGILARVSVVNVVLALVLTTPLLYVYGMSAIVPSIVIISFTQFVLTLWHTWRLFPPRFSFSRSVLAEGSGMIRLGMAFVGAGVFASGAEFLIRAALNNLASLHEVGLYNVGFMMTSTYAGMVLAAMESDFYPRLSAENAHRRKRNLLVNRQMLVSVLMLSPMLMAFTIGVPLLVPLLFSREFMDVVVMIQVTILSMYLRAVKLPVGYLTLARGESRAYLVLEAYSAVVLVAAVVGGFMLWGITGTGFGLLLTELTDLVVVLVFAHYHFGYRLSGVVVRLSGLQLVLALLVFGVSQLMSGAAYWLCGAALTMVSAVVSVLFFRRSKSLRAENLSR